MMVRNETEVALAQCCYPLARGRIGGVTMKAMESRLGALESKSPPQTTP